MGGSFKEGGIRRPLHEKKQELSWTYMVKPSSPQKGTGVFAKGVGPVRRFSHRGNLRLHLNKCGLSASATRN